MARPAPTLALVLGLVTLVAALAVATLPGAAEGAGNCKVKYKFKVGNPKLLLRFKDWVRDTTTMSYNSIGWPNQNNVAWTYNAGWKGSIHTTQHMYYRANPVGWRYCASPCTWILFTVSLGGMCTGWGGRWGGGWGLGNGGRSGGRRMAAGGRVCVGVSASVCVPCPPLLRPPPVSSPLLSSPLLSSPLLSSRLLLSRLLPALPLLAVRLIPMPRGFTPQPSSF